jgi:hypothetical protein
MSERTLCKLAIVGNYLVYAIATLAAGGDVLQGYIINGHYFAAAGGGFVEVERLLFEFCRVQAYSLAVTIPLLMLGAFRLTPVPHDPDELVLSRGD